MSLEVFFTADDFGADEDINQAIVAGHQKGVLNAASLMMGQAATDGAVRMAAENPGLSVGWHLHLCDSRPMTCRQWPWGGSPAKAGWRIFFSRSARRLMEKEITAQWEMFQATGLRCAFVNTHHHLHVHPSVQAFLREVLGDRFDGWMRFGVARRFQQAKGLRLAERLTGWFYRQRRNRCAFRISDTIWGIDRLFDMRAEEVRSAFRSLHEGLHEFMFHPRRPDSRDRDFATLIELRTLLS